MTKTQNFIGVILAAGIGSRLNPLTNNLPKCLIKTAGKEIIKYQIESFSNAGVKDLIIVVGHEALKLERYLNDFRNLNISIIKNKEYEFTNNMYSFYLASKKIKDRPFILCNADVVIDKNMVNHIINHKSKSGIATDKNFYSKESMKITINQKGYISDISKEISKDQSNGTSIDFYKFSSKDGKIFINEVNKIIEIEKNLKDWTEVALQRLFRKQILEFKKINILGKNWVEIDNFVDLSLSDRKFSNFDQTIKKIQSIFFDLDGTLFLGDKLLPKVASTILKLKKNKKKVFFISNNSSKDKTEYLKRFKKFKIKSNINEIIISSDALLCFLKKKKVKQVYVLGTKSLKKMISKSGINVSTKNPEYVVLGYDTEINYKKIVNACTYINKGVQIIATHIDNSCPSKNGPIPDIGSFIEMLKKTTGKSPIAIFGKPDKLMLQEFMKLKKIKKSKSLIVGDRLQTDILMSKNLGTKGLLVLTGDTNREMCQYSDIKPDFILNSIADFYQ